MQEIDIKILYNKDLLNCEGNTLLTEQNEIKAKEECNFLLCTTIQRSGTFPPLKMNWKRSLPVVVVVVVVVVVEIFISF